MRHRQQRGIVLFVVMIVLVAMLMGAIALTRSVDISTLVTGNLSFKKAALQGGDVGVEAALAELPNIIATSADAAYPAGCSSSSASPNGCRYYPTLQPTDAKGMPTAINWASVRSALILDGYRVKYVIDRLCNGPTPVSDLTSKCLSDAPLGGGSHKQDAAKISNSNKVYYRTTIKVEGPRSTESLSQVIVSY